MLDLLVSSKSASNCHNNTGNEKKNLSVKTAIWKGDPQPCKSVLSRELANIQFNIYFWLNTDIFAKTHQLPELCIKRKECDSHTLLFISINCHLCHITLLNTTYRQ
jgi:hypothetical protein